MQERSDLEQSVMKTLLWFSMVDHPLTAFEIWKWLMMPERAYGLGEVYGVLERSTWLTQKVESHQGFYACKGAGIKRFVAMRRERFLDAERKFSTLRRVAKYFSLLPAVRAVGAVNSLAWWGTQRESDIDLYIVTRSGHIWSSRFWLVVPFLLLGRRPTHQEGSADVDPFCFSFFATQNHLAMEELCLPRDYYMAFWVRSMVPVLDRDHVFEVIHQENRWTTRTLPNARPRRLHARHTSRRLPSLLIQWRILEPVFGSVQRNRFPDSLRALANVDTRVVITDDLLKFHENDRRAEFRDRFESLVDRHL